MFERNDLIFRAIGIFLIYQEEIFIKTNWSDPVVPHSLGQTVKEGLTLMVICVISCDLLLFSLS